MAFLDRFFLFWTFVISVVRDYFPKEDFAYILIIRVKSRKAVILRTERNPRYVDLLSTYDIRSLDSLVEDGKGDSVNQFVISNPISDAEAKRFVSSWSQLSKPSRTSVTIISGEYLDWLWNPSRPKG